MRNRFSKLFVFFLLIGVVLLLAGCGSDEPAGLVIKDVWSRAAPAADGNSAVFMIIENTGQEADVLTAATTSVAAAVELHETVMQGDVMTMQPISGQRLEIPAGGMVELKPGGLHIMLIGLTQPLEEGQSFAITLTFEKAGSRTLTVPVRAMAAPMPGM